MIKIFAIAVFSSLLATGLHVSHSLSNQLTRVEQVANERLIAITFDDGPDRHTEKVLRLFDEISPNSRATFFCFGEAARENSGLVREIHDRGHEIANHDWTDRVSDLCARSEPETFKADLTRTHRTLAEITGVEPRLFRPGCGIYGRELLRILHDLDVDDPYHPQPVLASHVPLDTGTELFNDIHRRWVTNCISDGSIIVLHLGSSRGQDRGARTLSLLPELLREIERRGYRSVTVSELIESSNHGQNQSNPTS